MGVGALYPGPLEAIRGDLKWPGTIADVTTHSYLAFVSRFAAFRFTLVPDEQQERVLARHAGARRFAYNQCLTMVHNALRAKQRDPAHRVPWSGYSLINTFNGWKRSAAAGRIIAVNSDGDAEVVDTGLTWRHEVFAGVFEEAAIDLGRAFTAYWDTRSGRRPGPRIGFPALKHKNDAKPTFRIRNRVSPTGKSSIRFGDAQPRSVTLPKIGSVPVREDTRRVRRLMRPLTDGTQRARIGCVTVSRRRRRWVASVTLEAPEMHPARLHPQRDPDDHEGFVGVDLGLTRLATAARADGSEVARIDAPKFLTRALPHLRNAHRKATRTKPRSAHRQRANARLARLHGRVADQRRHFLHQVTTGLVKTHDRLCVEDLAVANLVRNRHLARSIADAAWGELRRQLTYKAAWYGTELVVAPRFFASTRTCSACGQLHAPITLAQREFRCASCALVVDRDTNAAANLAAWAEAAHAAAAQTPDPEARGRVTNAPGGTGSARRHRDGPPGPATPSRKDGKNGEPDSAHPA